MNVPKRYQVVLRGNVIYTGPLGSSRLVYDCIAKVLSILDMSSEQLLLSFVL